ncbi:MAG: NYN domain-containing protein [Verrucomicrobiota bacterium]|nr:NYN domain-containing protein [Verrucomicrobiota bacterium]
MAVVRILVDGYSLLHAWKELAPGEARHSATARQELIRQLTQYRDAIGTPLTVIFDGGGAPPNTPEPVSPDGLEVLYSKKGQTADDLIERTAYRLKPYGEALAITNDYAERDTVIAMGGLAQSCEEFIQSIQETLREQAEFVKQHNRREATRFKR